MDEGSAAVESRAVVPEVTELPYDPATLLLVMYPRESKTDIHAETGTQVFQPRYP